MSVRFHGQGLEGEGRFVARSLRGLGLRGRRLWRSTRVSLGQFGFYVLFPCSISSGSRAHPTRKREGKRKTHMCLLTISATRPV